jgi:hypothetical protein
MLQSMPHHPSKLQKESIKVAFFSKYTHVCVSINLEEIAQKKIYALANSLKDMSAEDFSPNRNLWIFWP